MAQCSSLFQVRALAITFSSITAAAADIQAQGATAKIRSILTQVMGGEQHSLYLGEADWACTLMLSSAVTFTLSGNSL